MVESGEQACDFCGEMAMSNTRIVSEPTVNYHDGPEMAQVPDTVLCYECASKMTDYISAHQAESTGNSVDEHFLDSEEIGAILDLLRDDEELVLDRGVGREYGLRMVDGEWRRAYFPVPSPTKVETLSEDEAVEFVKEGNRISLLPVDQAMWQSYADGMS